MGKGEKQPIFLDLCGLRKELRKAGFDSMTARDRVDYLVPCINGVAECLRCYIRAYRQRDPERKFELVEELATEFAVLLCDIHIADDEHIWRGRKDGNGTPTVVKRIADYIARIDDGIERWSSSMRKGRPASEAGHGSGI